MNLGLFNLWPNPFGFHFTVCHFLSMPLDQQLSILYLKKAGLFGVCDECASYFIQITLSNLMLHFIQCCTTDSVMEHKSVQAVPYRSLWDALFTSYLGQKGSSQRGSCFNLLGIHNISACSQVRHSGVLIIP